MKNFLKMTFAAMLGTFLALFTGAVILFLFVLIMVSALESDKEDRVPERSVVEIRLDYAVPERTHSEELSGSVFSSLRIRKDLGLNDILANIKKAKNDPNVRGIQLDLNNFYAGGYGTVEAIRNGLLDFKSSGKFIIAVGTIISQKALYFASVADNIYMPEPGIVELKGLSTEIPFFKKTLDKLEIEAQIFHYGKYKSAIEPFKFDKMSEANRQQTSALLNSMYGHMLANLSKGRNLQADSIRMIAEGLLVRNAQDALRYRIIDAVYYKDQVTDALKKRLGLKGDDKVNLVPLSKYNNVEDRWRKSGRDKIAVIYAEGDIISSGGDDNSIGSENISGALRKAREDKNVKAVVLRVNSPGGDAITSDLIWREVVLTKKVKPVVVSMGTVAASGGYYISAPADVIVAEPNTITGSIGVFGIIPNMQKFFDHKLGITFDRVKTSKFSDFGTVNRPFNDQEKQFIQKEIDRIYETFVGKVATGRKKSFSQIHDIAQGRVWTGLQAKENGLIDEIGGLDKAISIAAQRAKIKEYSLIELPYLKGFIENILEDISAEARDRYMEYVLGSSYKYYRQMEYISTVSGIQARLPINPDVE